MPVSLPETRVHPETGQTLVRGVRTAVLSYKGETETVELSGWYAPDDPTGDSGLHNGVDMQVSDAALRSMKARVLGISVAEVEQIDAQRHKDRQSCRNA